MLHGESSNHGDDVVNEVVGHFAVVAVVVGHFADVGLSDLGFLEDPVR